MTLSEAVKLATFIVVAAMMAGLIKTILELRKSPLSIRKRAIVSDTQEYLSVWEIAHQWEGMDPTQTDQENVPAEIKRRINRVLQAYFRKELPLRKPDGYRFTGHHWLHTMLNVDNQHEKLWDDLGNDCLDMPLLDCLFVRRGEILHWCNREFIDPPQLWQKVPVPIESNKKPSGRHYDEEIDKNRCQAIAMTLWDLDPKIHPAHLAKSYAIQRFGNAQRYKDDETVKGWIGEVDPLKKVRKQGRPPEPDYAIELKIRG